MSQAEVRKAKEEMKAHAGYTESEERIKALIRRTDPMSVDRVFRALLLSGDIIREFPGHPLGYEFTLKFIASKEEEE